MRKILKTAVVANWLIIIVYIYVSKDTTWVSVSDVGVVVTLVSGFWVVGYLISTIGLFFIKPWAKWLYTILLAIDLVLRLFSGSLTEHEYALASVIGYLYTIAAIVILCLLFFTNVMSKKEQVK